MDGGRPGENIRVRPIKPIVGNGAVWSKTKFRGRLEERGGKRRLGRGVGDSYSWVSIW